MWRYFVVLIAVVGWPLWAHAQFPTMMAVGGASGGITAPKPPPPSSDPTIGILPSDRDAWGNWKMAGLQSIGGIPNRSTVCQTLEPLGSGQDDGPQINTAIGNCQSGDVLMLGDSGHCSTAVPCVFTLGLNSYIWLNKSITLRGASPGSAYIDRPTDFPYGSGLTMPSCPSSSSSALNYGCYQGNGTQVMVRLSPFANNTGNTQTACALTADSVAGTSSLSVTSGCASNFHVGDIVLLDENVAEQWMPDPMSNSGGAITVCSNDDYSDVFQVYNTPSGIAPGSDANSCPLTSQSAVYGAYTLNPDRQRNELKRVSAVSGTTITFDSPIMLAYRVSHSADLWYFGTQPLSQAGLENVSLRYGQDAIQFYFCQYCWAKGNNVAVSAVDNIAVWASFRVDVDQNYVHECAWPEPGEVCYNLEAKYDSSEILFEDNISVLANKVFASNGAGGGNVYAYNYVNAGYIEGDCCWQEMGLNASHLTGTHHFLFEGNLGFNMDSDDTHGGSSYATFYRNWSTATRTAFQGMTQGQGSTTLSFATWDDTANTCGQASYSGSPQRATGPAAHAYWFSFIGNILGTPNCTTAANGYLLNNHYGGPNNSDGIFLIGWYNTSQGQVNNDPITSTIYPATPPTISCAGGISPTCAVPTASCTTYGNNCATILYNNYDYVRAADCDGNGTCSTPTHSLPNSFYTASAPAFFTGFTWPWTNPANGGSYTTANYDSLPAKYRYDNAVQVGGGASGLGCQTAVYQNNADCEPFGPIAPTIGGVTVAGSTSPIYTSGAGSVGAVAVSESGGIFGGTLTLGGANAADFSLSSATLPANLNIAAAEQTCSTPTTYNITITPTQAGVTNSGTAYPLTVTCSPVGYPVTAFDPTHTNSNIILSQTLIADDTATNGTSTGSDTTTFGTTTKASTTEKMYFEMKCAISGGHGPGTGLADATGRSNSYLGATNDSAAFYVTTGSGTVLYYNNGAHGSWGGCVNGDTVGVTLDTTQNPAQVSIKTYHSGSFGSTSGPYALPSNLSNGAALYIGLDLFSTGDGGTVCTNSACAAGGSGDLPTGNVWWDNG